MTVMVVTQVPSMLDVMCGKILGHNLRPDKIVAGLVPCWLVGAATDTVALPAGGEFKPAYVWALIYLALSVRQWWSDNLDAVAREVPTIVACV